MAKPGERVGLSKAAILVALAVVVLLVAVGVWRFSSLPVDKEDARYRRAERACLSNTDSENGGAVKTGVSPDNEGVAASAGVSSRDTQKRGPNERVATGDWLKESDAIRTCIERRLEKEGPSR
jgi:hypothetical protein